LEAVRIDYPKQWFAIGAAIDIAVMATMLYFAYDSVEPFARGFWAACALLICVPLLLVLVPPMFTCHYIGEKGLRLRMGLLMNTTLPYRYIAAVADSKVNFGSVMVGIGVKFVAKRKVVFVTSSFKGLVSIKLDGPQQLGGPLRPLVDQVVLSVKDKEGFVALIKDRAGLEG
jgi:hypothetical protein